MKKYIVMKEDQEIYDTKKEAVKTMSINDMLNHDVRELEVVEKVEDIEGMFHKIAKADLRKMKYNIEKELEEREVMEHEHIKRW